MVGDKSRLTHDALNLEALSLHMVKKEEQEEESSSCIDKILERFYAQKNN